MIGLKLNKELSRYLRKNNVKKNIQITQFYKKIVMDIWFLTMKNTVDKCGINYQKLKIMS